MAIYTGMRKGELLALQWKDIDFENDLINVTKSLFNNHGRPDLKETKTEAGTRKVPLLRPLKQRLLSEYTIKDPSDDAFLFASSQGQPLTNNEYNTLYRHYQEKTGIACTAHQLRHSFATIAFECGIDPKTVQEILGHKQLSTTMDIYTEFRESRLKQITAELNTKMQ